MIRLALILAVLAGPAGAQQVCATHEKVLAFLAERYGETRRVVGITAKGAVMEVYAAEDTGTWTVLYSAPDGMTCMIASGNNFEMVAPEKPGTKM